MLFIMGTLFGGPYNIITSVIANNLDSHPSVHDSSKLLGTVNGIINGTGSLVSSIRLLFIGTLQATIVGAVYGFMCSVVLVLEPLIYNSHLY